MSDVINPFENYRTPEPEAVFAPEFKNEYLAPRSSYIAERARQTLAEGDNLNAFFECQLSIFIDYDCSPLDFLVSPDPIDKLTFIGDSLIQGIVEACKEREYDATHRLFVSGDFNDEDVNQVRVRVKAVAPEDAA